MLKLISSKLRIIPSIKRTQTETPTGMILTFGFPNIVKFDMVYEDIHKNELTYKINIIIDDDDIDMTVRGIQDNISEIDNILQNNEIKTELSKKCSICLNIFHNSNLYRRLISRIKNEQNILPG